MGPDLVICPYMSAREIGKYSVQMSSMYPAKYQNAVTEREFLPHHERKTSV